MLEQSDVIQLFEDFSDLELDAGDQVDTNDSGCEHVLDNYIHHFCGTVRKTPTPALQSILSRSCYGDSYKQGLCQIKMGDNNLLIVVPYS